MKLDGARAVITGASRGIGEALAHSFASRGARVVLVARDADALEKLAADTGGEAMPADLTKTREIADLVDRIEAGGPIDLLVNNAGVDLVGELTELRADQIEQLFTLNLVAPVLLSRAVLPGMRARERGHIVNVSSMAATNAVPGLVPYAASKAGLSHFTAGLRAECKGTAIKTTLVEIGTVVTTMLDNVQAHDPTRRAFQRLKHLQLLPDLEVETVVGATVHAVEHDRRHVRLPYRDALFPMIVEAPRRLTEVLLLGVKAQRKDRR
jgi:short-subunit dehydrogenase